MTELGTIVYLLQNPPGLVSWWTGNGDTNDHRCKIHNAGFIRLIAMPYPLSALTQATNSLHLLLYCFYF
jgi:hypothetical protein